MEERRHFDKLTISRFRGLSRLELDGLGDFNVLLGANDVGKTSVLEAIFLLTGFANLNLPVRVTNWRNYVVHDFDALSLFFNDLNTKDPIEIEAISRDSLERRNLVIAARTSETGAETETERLGSGRNGDGLSATGAREAADRSTSSIPSGRRALLYEATLQRTGAEQPLAFSGTLVVRDGNPEVTIDPPSGVDEIISARFVLPRFEYNSDSIAEVIVNKKKALLVEYLRRINPRIEDVAVSGNVVHVDTGLRTMMPLNMFGSGMVRAAHMLAFGIEGDHRILLIDEIENGLHYRAIPPLLEALIKFSSDRGVQVYITTHSLDILSALQHVLGQDEFARYRSKTNCYALHTDKESLVRSYRYEYSQFDHCLAHGIEIR